MLTSKHLVSWFIITSRSASPLKERRSLLALTTNLFGSVSGMIPNLPSFWLTKSLGSILSARKINERSSQGRMKDIWRQAVFMGFEASAARDGFPVEVGWAWVEGPRRSDHECQILGLLRLSRCPCFSGGHRLWAEAWTGRAAAPGPLTARDTDAGRTSGAQSAFARCRAA